MQEPTAGTETQPFDKLRKYDAPSGEAKELRSVRVEGSSEGPVDDDLREIFRLVWRRKFWISGPIVVVMALTIALLPFLEPRYSAEAFVQIDPRETNIIDIESVVSGLSTDVASILGEVQVIQSRSLARATIEIGGFTSHPELVVASAPQSFIDGNKIASIDSIVPAAPPSAVRAGSAIAGGLAPNDKLPNPEIRHVASLSPTSLVSNWPSIGTDVPVETVNRFLLMLSVSPVSS